MAMAKIFNLTVGNDSVIIIIQSMRLTGMKYSRALAKLLFS